MTLHEQPPAQHARRLSPSVARPGLSTVVGRVSMSLLIACVVPAALFFVIFELAGVWPAILVALVWSYGAIGYRALTGRRTSGLLCLTAVVMTGRTVVALVAHSTFLYFLQPIITDGVVAGTFLLSLASARPMVARLAGDFYPMDNELASRPGIRRLFRNLTVLWALVCLAKSISMLCLLLSQPLSTFIILKSISMPAANLLTVVVTITAATTVAHKEGLVGVHSSVRPA